MRSRAFAARNCPTMPPIDSPTQEARPMPRKSIVSNASWDSSATV
jgi:hypothetical protein